MSGNTQGALVYPMSNNSLQRELGVYQTRHRRSDTTCWESQFPLDQSPHVLVNDRIAEDKDPREVVIPCHKTHGECWFI